MHETPQEIEQLQRLLDESARGAGPHLLGIMTPDHRMSAADLCEKMQGMRILALATVTGDGRPFVAPVDGYLIHGSWYFSSGKESVRMRHLARRPAVSATHAPNEELAITVHGRSELFEVNDTSHPELRQAMLDHYLPRQGEAFKAWLDQIDALGARIEAAKLFTYQASGLV